ncbi:sensor domain-containing diguanylate cyclase [Gorillibacterium sp. CAU 1737]|uniref:sensor domain-containing diguanylate cyclase n=1 Tax=Gorillibacterium sp. CAU 1737 TaxID=3140362 RepID=UPI00326025D4
MTLQNALLLACTHGLPILYLAYSGTDLLLRNRKRKEYVLVSLIAYAYLLLFAEEYIRNQVSIEYSPMLSQWFSLIGITLPGFGLHFLMEHTRFSQRFPRWLYPWVFYVPLFGVALLAAAGGESISIEQFTEAGPWKMPVFSSGYYIGLTASLLIHAIFFALLWAAKRKAPNQELRSVYRKLVFGSAVSFVWISVFGYLSFGASLPPYPYLYCGIIWCFYLQRAMRAHNFLVQYDKRFERLFQLNPDLILLLDEEGNLKNANPAAMKFFASFRVKPKQFFSLLPPDVKARFEAEEELLQVETTVRLDRYPLHLVLNGGYLWIENERHILLILRDITVERLQREEIEFLAYHDSLTRLANRKYFYSRLEQVLADSRDKGETLALLLIDLDKLKWLNDTLGHRFGDEAIKEVARILSERVQGRGMAARLGGDEFVLFVRSPSQQEVAELVQRIQEEYAGFTVRFGATQLGVSIGTSFYPADGSDIQTLVHAADHSMFEMKRLRYEHHAD